MAEVEEVGKVEVEESRLPSMEAEVEGFDDGEPISIPTDLRASVSKPAVEAL